MTTIVETAMTDDFVVDLARRMEREHGIVTKALAASARQPAEADRREDKFFLPGQRFVERLQAHFVAPDRVRRIGVTRMAGGPGGLSIVVRHQSPAGCCLLLRGSTILDRDG